MSATVTGRKTLFEGWTTLSMLGVRLEDGTEYERVLEDHGDAAAVLPYDPERRIAFLVRQLRAPLLHRGAVDASPLEAPAGIVDEDDPAETARREAFEEVGLRLEAIEAVASVWSMPGISAERMALFLAPCSAASRISEGGGLADEHERITVEELPLDALWAMTERGEIEDMKTLALVFALRLRHPDLFG